MSKKSRRTPSLEEARYQFALIGKLGTEPGLLAQILKAIARPEAKQIFGQNVRFIRRFRDFTAGELDHAAAVPYNFIGKLESHRSTVGLTPIYVVQISAALDVPPLVLFREDLRLQLKKSLEATLSTLAKKR